MAMVMAMVLVGQKAEQNQEGVKAMGEQNQEKAMKAMG
jgi:hypothetical protein